MTTAPKATAAKPFLKWCGGKRAMLPVLRPLVPPTFCTYHEPFLGGGALFFDRLPARAVLSDQNEEIVNAYRVVRDDVDGLIAELGQHRYEKAHYLEVRDQRPANLPATAQAARTVFLNRTCFNGMYRVNEDGQFNIPFGRYTNPVICDEPNLRACSAALQGVTIVHGSFEAALSRVSPGDFVYFDPPYVPVSKTASFTSYTKHPFGLRDQRLLRDVALELSARDVCVLLSNSNAQAVFDLYADGFKITRVQAPRSVGAKRTSRRAVEEVVIVGPGKATAVECLERLRTPTPDDAEPTAAVPSSPRPEPETPSDFFPACIGPLPGPVTDEALQVRIVGCSHFDHLARIVRGGRVDYRRSALGYRWVEIPYQLVVEAGRPGEGLFCAADEGVGDVTTAFRNHCLRIATAAGVEHLEPLVEGPSRQADVARVQRIVESLLASDVERLKREAEVVWVQARAAYAERRARLPA